MFPTRNEQQFLLGLYIHIVPFMGHREVMVVDDFGVLVPADLLGVMIYFQ